MGYILNVDLETSNGPSHEVYVRIESFKVNRVTSKARFQLTYWIDKEHASRFNKTYVEEEDRPMVGLVRDKVIYYENDESEGVEKTVPNLIEVDLAREEEVTIPTLEEKEVTKEVPYTSFDENGEEIKLYRTITSIEKIETGMKKEMRKMIDPKLAANIFEFGYEKIKIELGKIFPSKKIEIL
jgi:hypothetical protein